MVTFSHLLSKQGLWAFGWRISFHNPCSPCNDFPLFSMLHGRGFLFPVSFTSHSVSQCLAGESPSLALLHISVVSIEPFAPFIMSLLGRKRSLEFKGLEGWEKYKCHFVFLWWWWWWWWCWWCWCWCWPWWGHASHPCRGLCYFAVAQFIS